MQRSPRFAGRTVPIVTGALLAIGVAGLGAAMTDLSPWYYALERPPWQPPDWAFGPAWTLIFGLATVAGIETWWHSPDARARRIVLFSYLANGALNVLWSALFFKLRRPDWALWQVVTLWLSILVLIRLATGRSTVAVWCLVPYLLWVSFAAALTWAVVRLNGPF